MIWIFFFFTSLAFVFICAFRCRFNRLFAMAYVIFCSCIFTAVYSNGIDWVNYYYVFDGFKSEFSINYDLLFNIYLYVLANLSINFQSAIFIFYLLSFYIAFIALKKAPIPINIPATLLAMCLLGGLSLVVDQIRQFVAIVICFHSINFLLDKRIRLFIVSVLIASLFHYSAIIVLIFWHVYYSERKPLVIKGICITTLMVLIGGIVLSNTEFVYSIPVVGVELARKASLYSESLSSVGFGFGIIADLIIITRFLIRKSKDEYTRIWNIIFIFACLHIGIYFIPAFSRFYYYMFIPLTFLFGYILSTYRKSVIAYDSIAIVSTVILISSIVTVKTFSDEKRPGLLEYRADWIMDNERSVEMLRNKRCENLNDFLRNFCAG